MPPIRFREGLAFPRDVPSATLKRMGGILHSRLVKVKLVSCVLGNQHLHAQYNRESGKTGNLSSMQGLGSYFVVLKVIYNL